MKILRKVEAASEYDRQSLHNYKRNRYAIKYTDVDSSPEADPWKMFKDFKAQISVSNPYDDATYYWAKIENGVIKYIRDGKVESTNTYMNADDMDVENDEWCDDVIDIALRRLGDLNADIEQRIIHNSTEPDCQDSEPIVGAKTAKGTRTELYNKAKQFMKTYFGFTDNEVDHYLVVEVSKVHFDDNTDGYKFEVRAELDYDEMSDLISELDPIIMTYDPNAYFDMDEPGIASAYTSVEKDIYGADDEATEADDSEFDMPQVDQEYDSRDTSINSTKLPAIYKLVNFTPGDLVLDYGGGKFDNAVEEMAKNDVTVLVYDPYNRSQQHNREVIKQIRSNGGSDISLCSNVLNVIKEPEARLNVLQNIAKLTRPGGKVYITVYEGSGKGNEGATKSGYQLNRKTSGYLEEIQQVFPDATRKGKLIQATNSGITSSTYVKSDRLDPPENTSYEYDADMILFDVYFDTNITVDSEGNWDYEDNSYSWLECTEFVGDKLQDPETGLTIRDRVSAGDDLDWILTDHIPESAGRYHIQGSATLAYEVDGIEYDSDYVEEFDDGYEERTYYDDNMDVTFNLDNSSLNTFKATEQENK